MEELAQSWDRIGPIWWLIIWRGVVGSLVIVFVLSQGIGFLVGLIPANFSDDHYWHSLTILTQISRILIVTAAYLVWWPNVIRMALKKHYSGFRIALVPTVKPD